MLIDGAEKALGIILLFSFIYGVVKIITAAANYERDPDAAKKSIVGGCIIAGSCAILGILFVAFGIDFGLTPNISF